MKQTLMLIIALLFPFALHAQDRGTQVKGRVIGSESKNPLSGIVVTVDKGPETRTDANGYFFFGKLSAGKLILHFRSAATQPRTLTFDLKRGVTNNLGNIEIFELQNQQDISLVGVLDESMLDDDAESSQNISSTVILSNDVFLNKAGYQFSPFRFRARGYDGVYEKKYINGISFNDQWRGLFNYSSIGAMNDMTRNGDRTNYDAPSMFGYGSLGGMENINMRASSYAHGSKAALSLTNRNYYLRGMYTFATGLRKDGWALAASVGGRYSDKGAIPGTFYRNVAYSLSLEKVWDEGRHSLSFVTFGSPVVRGQQGSSTQEVYDLVNDNLYNPNWGYQNGKRRNAKVVHSVDPTFILSHKWKINDKGTLTTGYGTHYSVYGGSAINWYDAPDPRPDYYRELPSYFAEFPQLYKDRELLWRRNDPAFTQLNWDKMIEINRLNPSGAALYLVEDRRSDLWEHTLNSTLNYQLGRIHTLTAGIEGRFSQSHQFKTVKDLLGAEYVMDYDKFAERDFVGDISKKQNDLNRPDRKVYKNGIFGYNFNVNIFSSELWLTDRIKGARWEGYYGGRLSYTHFYRDGKMRNGHYPESSYGKGKSHSFTDFGVKAGLMYKFNGRHFVSANVSYGTYAPIPYNSYISPRIADKAVRDLQSNKVLAADVNYIFSTPKLNGRVTLFQTNFFDDLKRSSYYDDSQRTFVNCVINGLNRVHRGVEAGVTYKLDGHWSFDLAGTVSEYTYANNPTGTFDAENGKPLAKSEETVYLKNYHVGGAPQVIGTFGVRYFINYWFFGANINGFGRNYIDLAPSRHLASAYQTINPTIGSELAAYESLTDQEKFKSDFTIDLSIGKIYYLKNRNAINFNLSVSNVLNNKDVKTGGYEQGRLDLKNPKKFASKYFYMQGINCFANLSYRF